MILFLAIATFLILQLSIVLFGDYKKFKQKWKNNTVYMILDSIFTISLLCLVNLTTEGKGLGASIFIMVCLSFLFAILSTIIRKIFSNSERKNNNE